jgi:carbamoyltransferase
MIRLGVKVTHDGSLALLDESRLVFCHEAEKSDNNRRHADLAALDVSKTLEMYGFTLDDIDRVVVDGWLEGRAIAGLGDRHFEVPVASYFERKGEDNPLAPLAFDRLPLGDRNVPYLSYPHAVDHGLSAYATSPWAAARQSAYVLVWDGAMFPRLYWCTPDPVELRFVGSLFGLIGMIYPIFATFFEPFAPPGGRRHELGFGADVTEPLDVPGKVMAYVALGGVDEKLVSLFDAVLTATHQLRWDYIFTFAEKVVERLKGADVVVEDVLASFQAWLGRKLVNCLIKALRREGKPPYRLCFAGGCALNIAWNAQLRSTGLFEDVWVPPFPNDAGSAIGCAASDLIRSGEGLALEWDVYSGPPLVDAPVPGWRQVPCDIPQLARLLHRSGEPVVFLTGRAEIGPRALGNRSILCSAVAPATKDRLNGIKKRDWYRPVAPICLEEHAPAIFDPGNPDPYMLFTHLVRPAWREKVPAIVHLDGTARLQTIRRDQNPVVAELLTEYHRASGIPLLCNTSANHKGSGFFPDLRSAAQWGGTDLMWSDGTLYASDSARLDLPDHDVM